MISSKYGAPKSKFKKAKKIFFLFLIFTSKTKRAF